MPFAKGDPVNIFWSGRGIITDVVGGPNGPLYHVLMRELTPHGFRTELVVGDADLEPDEPLPVYEVGQIVTIQGRAGTVTGVNGEMISVLTEPDPAEYGDAEHYRHFILPAWQLTAKNNV
jgi:hypothetical protein